MLSQSLQVLALSALLTRVAGQTAAENTETVRAVVIIHNACDRTAFTSSSQSASTTYTGLLTGNGANQCYDSGTFYRNRYLSSNSYKQINGMDKLYNLNTFTAYVPQTPLYTQGGTAFLQGLYPPVEASDVFGNSSDTSDTADGPLNGYQYSILNTISKADPRYTLVRGYSQCYNAIKDSNTYYGTADFRNMLDSTNDFYLSLMDPYLQGVFDVNYVNFGYAYDIYDYISQNQANETLAAIPKATLEALRVYASMAEFNRFANLTTSPSENWAQLAKDGLAIRDISARTMATNVLEAFRGFINTPTQSKLTFLMGDYSTFLSFAAIANLTSVSPHFKEIPPFGSSMVFELVSTSFDPNRSFDEQTDGLKVRFGLRNTTNISSFPLFDSKNQLSLPWDTFNDKMSKIGVQNYIDWCSFCKSTATFCRAADQFVYNITVVPTKSGSKSGMSAAIGGVIGAFVTLAVAAIIFIGFLFLGGFAIRRDKDTRSNSTKVHRRRPSFMLNLGKGSKSEKNANASDMELALSPRAERMGQRLEDDDPYDDEHEYDYNTRSSTATAVSIQRPGEVHIKDFESRI